MVIESRDKGLRAHEAQPPRAEKLGPVQLWRKVHTEPPPATDRQQVWIRAPWSQERKLDRPLGGASLAPPRGGTCVALAHQLAHNLRSCRIGWQRQLQLDFVKPHARPGKAGNLAVGDPGR